MIKPNRRINVWFKVSALMVLVVIFVGGFTRLTHSGLSIVEWKPVTGIVPPVSLSSWLSEFHKYQNSPEYKLVNYNITLKDFKFLYLTEYFHRLLGRVSGLVFVIPLGYFWLRGDLTFRLKVRSIIILTLGAMQGLIGWYMVKSGLYNEPHVSHFRLATHLIIATLIYSMLIWESARLSFNNSTLHHNFSNGLCYFGGIILMLCYIQIFLGGLVAGVNGGLIYNQFPLMGESFVPSELHNFENYSELLTNPAILQFWHRVSAYFLTVCIVAFSIQILMYNLKKTAYLLQGSVFIQLTLGIAILLTKLNIYFALAHQLTAFALLAIVLITNHNIFKNRKHSSNFG